MALHIQHPHYLGNCQISLYFPRMRLPGELHDAVTQADDAHGAGQNMSTQGRAEARGGELLGDCLVEMTGSSEFHDALFHLLAARKLLQRSDRDGDIEHSDIAAPPHDAGMNAIARGPMDDDLVDQTTQQRLFSCSGQERSLPQFRQVFSEFCEGRPQFSANRLTCDYRMLRIFIDSRLSLPQISKCFFPTML